MTRRLAFFLYGLVAYAVFFATFLYLIGFVGDLLVPKSINDGPATPLPRAILIDVLLIALFGVQHSVMARPWFKTRWTRLVPKPIERSTFVLVASLMLVLLVWQWRPIPGAVWEAQAQALRAILWGLFFAGWAIVLYASFLIDHFDLFGLRQVFLYLREREYTHPRLIVRSLYRWIRHPLMLGFLIALWATPLMTEGHLLFALGMTGYIFVGIAFEERDIARALGPEYEAYRSRTPMLAPGLKPARGWIRRKA